MVIFLDQMSCALKKIPECFGRDKLADIQQHARVEVIASSHQYPSAHVEI